MARRRARSDRNLDAESTTPSEVDDDPRDEPKFTIARTAARPSRSSCSRTAPQESSGCTCHPYRPPTAGSWRKALSRRRRRFPWAHTVPRASAIKDTVLDLPPRVFTANREVEHLPLPRALLPWPHWKVAHTRKRSSASRCAASARLRRGCTEKGGGRQRGTADSKPSAPAGSVSPAWDSPTVEIACQDCDNHQSRAQHSRSQKPQARPLHPTCSQPRATSRVSRDIEVTREDERNNR